MKTKKTTANGGRLEAKMAKKAAKKAAKKQARAAAAEARVTVSVRSVDAPPKAFPGKPPGFKALSNDAMKRLRKPTESQRPRAKDLADELDGADSYYDDFGKRAPDPADLAGRLRLAAQWDAIHETASRWAAYAMTMRATAWDGALERLGKLETKYADAVDDEPAIAERYREIAQFVAMKDDMYERAAETRRHKDEAANQGNGANAPPDDGAAAPALPAK